VKVVLYQERHIRKEREIDIKSGKDTPVGDGAPVRLADAKKDVTR